RQFAQAEALLRPALQRAERSLGRDHPLTLNMYSNLGGAIRQQPGRNAEARPYYERTLAISRSLYGEHSRMTVLATVNLGLLLRDDGQLDAAERTLRQAISAAEGVIAAGDPLRAKMLDEFATVLMREHKYGEAEAGLKHA